MEYDTMLTDVHGDFYIPQGNGEGVPNEADSPVEMFEKVLAWAKSENIMPDSICLGIADSI